MKKRLALFLAILMMASLLSSCEIEEYEEEGRRNHDDREEMGVLMTEETGNGYENPWNAILGFGTTSIESFTEIETLESCPGTIYDCTDTYIEETVSSIETFPPKIDPTIEDTTADPSETAWETTADPEENKFEFSYEISRSNYRIGETISITATITNVSGENYYYVGSSSGFMASVSICYCGPCEVVYYLEHEPFESTDDYMGQIIEPGESRSREYIFPIPEGAIIGEYAIILSYGDESFEKRYAIQIFEEGYSVDYDYQNYTGSCVIGSDGVAISPISGFWSESYRVENSGDDVEQGYEADGEGAWGIMYKVSAWNDDSFIPKVYMLHGEALDLSFGDFVLERVNVVLSGKTYDDQKYIEVEQLARLPVGEYYVLMTLAKSESGQSWSRETVFQDVFKLCVTKNGETDSGYEAGLKMIRYNWDGYGVSKKEIFACDLGYAIIDRLSDLQKTGVVVPEFSYEDIDELAGYLPITPGSVWIDCGSVGLFRLNPDMTEICLVQTYFGEGLELQMTDNLYELLRRAWYYHPYDCWSGSYKNGTVTLEHVYKTDSAIDTVEIESIYIENKIDSKNNQIKLKIQANESKLIKASLYSYQSDDNLGSNEAKEIELVKGEVTELEFEFYGFPYSYSVTIYIDNTRITLSITPDKSN